MAAAGAITAAQGSLAISEKAKLRRVLRRFGLVLFNPFLEWVTLGSLLVMVVLGLVCWELGERKRRTGLLGIAVEAEVTADGQGTGS